MKRNASSTDTSGALVTLPNGAALPLLLLTRHMRILDLVKPKDLSRLSQLQLLAKDVVEGYTSGKHRSPHKGFSVEFKEHRQYVQGDELKNIDWKVYGKSDRLYIRQYEEETTLRCNLLVDVSGSMNYAGDKALEGKSKREYAVGLAASFAYFMLGQQDPVGLITFDNQLRREVPLRSRPGHLTPLLTALTDKPTERETDLGSVFRKIVPKIGRRGLVVIISDSMGDSTRSQPDWHSFALESTKCCSFKSWIPTKLNSPSAVGFSFTTWNMRLPNKPLTQLPSATLTWNGSKPTTEHCKMLVGETALI